jgi:hypothetical protein
MALPLWLTTSFWMLIHQGGWPDLRGWYAEDSWILYFKYWSERFLNKGSRDGVVGFVYLTGLVDPLNLRVWTERSQHLWVVWYLLFLGPWFVPRLRTLGFTLLQLSYASLQCAAFILGYFGLWRSYGGC